MKGHSAKPSVHSFGCAGNLICLHGRSCSEGEPAQRIEAYAHDCEEKQQQQQQKLAGDLLHLIGSDPLCFSSTQGRCSPGSGCFLLEFNLETSVPFKGPLKRRRNAAIIRSEMVLRRTRSERTNRLAAFEGWTADSERRTRFQSEEMRLSCSETADVIMLALNLRIPSFGASSFSSCQ